VVDGLYIGGYFGVLFRWLNGDNEVLIYTMDEKTPCWVLKKTQQWAKIPNQEQFDDVRLGPFTGH
jgi:hypothetical protein